LEKKDEQIKQLEQLISQLECSAKDANNIKEEVMKQECRQNNEDKENAVGRILMDLIAQ
jgi:hypothetical protein